MWLQMTNYRNADCNCPQNCEEVTYSVFESKEPLNPEEFNCQSKWNDNIIYDIVVNKIED